MNHTIEIEGLPEGWEPVAADLETEKWENRLGDTFCMARVKLQKSKPRRIVAPDGITDPSGLWVTKDGVWILKEES